MGCYTHAPMSTPREAAAREAYVAHLARLGYATRRDCDTTHVCSVATGCELWRVAEFPDMLVCTSSLRVHSCGDRCDACVLYTDTRDVVCTLTGHVLRRRPYVYTYDDSRRGGLGEVDHGLARAAAAAYSPPVALPPTFGVVVRPEAIAAATGRRAVSPLCATAHVGPRRAVHRTSVATHASAEVTAVAMAAVEPHVRATVGAMLALGATFAATYDEARARTRLAESLAPGPGATAVHRAVENVITHNTSQGVPIDLSALACIYIHTATARGVLCYRDSTPPTPSAITDIVRTITALWARLRPTAATITPRLFTAACMLCMLSGFSRQDGERVLPCVPALKLWLPPQRALTTGPARLFRSSELMSARCIFNELVVLDRCIDT